MADTTGSGEPSPVKSADVSKRPPAGRKRTPGWIRRPGRWLSGNKAFAAGLAWLGYHFLNLVFRTNKWALEPEDILDTVKTDLPVIVAVWHGQHILLPAIPIGMTASVMISRSLDGEITARIAEKCGARPIRASGGRDSKATLKKGALKGFLDMQTALERGENVLQTADVPKGTARRVGQGIVALAHRTGRPILPMAVASSRRWTLPKSWDRTTVNLPFGKSAIVVGDMIYVPPKSESKDLQNARMRVQSELDRITARAYELTGIPEPTDPKPTDTRHTD